MEISRREALVVGGTAAGVVAGGFLGAGVREVTDDPPRRIVATRGDDAAAAAERTADGDGEVVDLGERRTLVVGRFTDAEVERLREEHEIDYVEPDLRVDARDGTVEADADPRELPWGVDRVDAPGAHDGGYRGNGASVAVVDSGVSPHPDVEPNLAEGAAFVDCQGDCGEAWYDDAGHGTACAGVIAATGADDAIMGIAPEATVHPVKVLDASNAGRVSRVVEGLRWAVARGCDVANLSVSGPVSRAFEDAIRFARLRGTVVVASAGNVGPCDDCINPLATHPQVIAVTATDRDDELARFSATGREAELAAPGVGVTTTAPDGYATKNGTSFAAPHVAGAAALCRAAGRSASVTRNLITGGAEPLPLEETAQGSGILDVRSAVVPGVRTDRPVQHGYRVTFRGTLPRIVGDRAQVWFSFRWRPRRRWRQTTRQLLTSAGEFSSTIRLLQGLTYYVRAHARLPDGREFVGRRKLFRMSLRG